MELSVAFDHGLGDCANFAHVLELYRRRGYRISVNCADDKAIVFAAVGATRLDDHHPSLQRHGWPESFEPEAGNAELYWRYNKAAHNVSRPPLPDIGAPESLWQELCDVRLNVTPHVSGESRARVERFLRGLPRPVVLVHSMGNTMPDRKNLPPETTLELYGRLLDRTDGTLVLLDWDDRVPRLASGRVRHMSDDWEKVDTATLIALLQSVDLLVSVDSGPLHLARLTDVPAVGLFPTPTTYPSRMALPRERSVCVVPRGTGHELSLGTRILYNVVESPGTGLDPGFVAEVCGRVLDGPRYLDRDRIGADVVLRQFLDWERHAPHSLTTYGDRHRGFDVLLREARARFRAPLVVETGCVREEEDWSAGYGTYLLGAFTHRSGGSVRSVDIDPAHCEFARRATREMRGVTVEQGDSVAFLSALREPIDVLVLDSMDNDLPGHEEHGLREIEAAWPRLHERSVVAIDDTVWSEGRFTGKGALAVPWLLERGWRVLHSGVQTILTLNGREAPCES